jgi:hypothetical protein
MSTIGLPNWAVDLKDVGAIYPYQGWEVPMAIAALVFWVLWHLWQLGHEGAELRSKSSAFDTEKAKRAIDRY